ncbi:hypothetical protein NC653_005151 [Populus alba x Populus x berolinensis]|uniref:Uncharacterized protein n=1 Tax=Populus alba x Populus x berolinensis TaxID=444605 RepID=A0AAD6RBN4_9ROSI|nr:hypothetical protein NC653_005151 [Populus alba x Populus x berolinensis]
MSNLVYNSSKLSLSLAAKRDDEEEAQLSPYLSVSLLPFVLRTSVNNGKKQPSHAFVYPAFETQFMWAPWSYKTVVAVEPNRLMRRNAGNVDAATLPNGFEVPLEAVN